MWAQRQLLEHAAPLMHATLRIAATHVAQRLDMEMLLLAEVDIGQHDILALDGKLAMVQAMAPFRMAVAESQHVEIVERRERRLQRLRTFAKDHGGRRRMSCAGLPV